MSKLYLSLRKEEMKVAQTGWCVVTLGFSTEHVVQPIHISVMVKAPSKSDELLFPPHSLVKKRNKERKNKSLPKSNDMYHQPGSRIQSGFINHFVEFAFLQLKPRLWDESDKSK